MTRSKSISKRLGAMIMACAMMFAMAISANAADTANETTETYQVTIYKKNGTSISMANGIVAGNATATTAADGKVRVNIPIKPIYNYTAMGMFTADGYLKSVVLSGATGIVTPNTTTYPSASLTITANSMPSNLRFAVTSSRIDLYKVGTSNPYWMSHVSPAFVIALTPVSA